MIKLSPTLAGALTAALALSLVAASAADARRGGSFGSRGSRTYSAPRPTPSTPGYTAPVQRSMTPPTQGGASPYGFQPTGPSYMPGGGFNNPYARRGPGFGTGLAAGLLTGGLIGGLMGHGWGMGWGGYGGGYGMGGGLLTIVLQLIVLGLILSFVMRLFRRRAFAGAGGGFASPFDAGPEPGPWGAHPGGYAPAAGVAYPSPASEIAVSSADRAAFERLLTEVQGAFGREDYASLRQICTPEVMGYLAEELSENATHNRRNDVSAVRLIKADVSEAWQEGDADYATMALTYESIDVMRDRQSGAVVQGDPDHPTETTELWTFLRHAGGPWKLSAIQT